MARPYLKVSLATSCKDPAGIETAQKRRKEQRSKCFDLSFALTLVLAVNEVT